MDKQVILVSIAAITLVVMTILHTQKLLIFNIPDAIGNHQVAEANIKQRNSGDYAPQTGAVGGNLNIIHNHAPNINQQQSNHWNDRLNDNLSASTQSLATDKDLQTDLTHNQRKLGDKLYEKRRFEDATEHYKLAIHNEIQARGKNSRDILILKNKLANSYLWSGKPEDAIKIYHQIIEIYTAKHGKDRRELEPVFRHLGEAYIRLSDTLRSPYH